MDVSTTEWSEHRRWLLSDSFLGVDVTVLLNRGNIGVGYEVLELMFGEITGKAVDDFPPVGNRGGTIGPTRECVTVGFRVHTVPESDDVRSGFHGLLDFGGRDGECGEYIEKEDGEEVLGEHVDVAKIFSGTLACIYGIPGRCE